MPAMTTPEPLAEGIYEAHLGGADPVAPVVLDALFRAADLNTRAECHGTDAACAPYFLALGIDYATGKSLPAQSVFRVE